MRARLLLTLCLGASFACADPEEQDAGTPVDTGVLVDSGVRVDSGFPADTGVTTDTGVPVDTGLPGDTGVDSGLPEDTGADTGLPGDTGPADSGDPDAGDGGTPDTGVDGGQLTGPITVTFNNLGLPFPSSAMFHDSTGVLIASRTTTTGVIIQDVPQDAMLTITALPTFTGKGKNAFELYTLVGIQPGDVYNVDRLIRGIPVSGDMTLGVGTAFINASYYILDYGCETFFVGDPTQPITVGIETGCSGSSTTTIDLLAIAYDEFDAPIAYRVGEQIPVVPNGSATLTDPWQTNFQSLDISVLNPRIGADSVSVGASLTSRGATYGDGDGAFGFIDLVVAPSGTAALSLPTFGDGMVYQVNLAGAGGEYAWLFGHPTIQGPRTIDLTLEMLPFPDVTVMTPSVTAPDRPTSSWTAVNGIDFIAFRFSSEDPLVEWAFVLPPGTTSFVLPELPDDLADARPTVNSTLYGLEVVFESNAINSYADVRAAAGVSFLRWTETLQPDQLPPNVTVRGALNGLWSYLRHLGWLLLPIAACAADPGVALDAEVLEAGIDAATDASFADVASMDVDLVDASFDASVDASPDAADAQPDAAPLDGAQPDGSPLDVGTDAGPIVDLDQDGLDDGFERALVEQNLPFLAIDPNDACPLSVALFRARPHPDDAALVHVIVDVLFERDCGAAGHVGDNEVFAMTIDPRLPPPDSVRSLRAIAHQATVCQEISECGAGCALTACDVVGVRPVIYYSRGKHGSYVSEMTCDNSCFFTNFCTATSSSAEPPLFNAGEPDFPLLDDLTAAGAITSTAGWTEAEVFDFDPWGVPDFGGAGNVREDFLDPAFLTPACMP